MKKAQKLKEIVQKIKIATANNIIESNLQSRIRISRQKTVLDLEPA